MRTALSLGLLLIAGAVSACDSSSMPASPSSVNVTGGGAGASSTSTQVYILGRDGGSSFSPSPATVGQGSTVVWVNSDTEIHRIVADDGSFDTGQLEPDAQSAPIVIGASVASYRCSLHAGEVGSITPK
jgi:plastocyanin